MNIKELKENVIHEIKTKLVSFFKHPDFETHLYTLGREMSRYEYKHKEFTEIKRCCLPRICHFPLTLLLNPEHEYTRRYLHHYFVFKMHEYYSNPLADIYDYIDIKSDCCSYGGTTTLSKRPIETLLSMNMAILSYSEMLQYKSDAETKLLTKFTDGVYFVYREHLYKTVVPSVLSPTHDKLCLKVQMMNLLPTSKNFGKVETSESLNIPKEVAENILIKSVEDVRRDISDKLSCEIEKSNKKFDNLQTALNDIRHTINLLEKKKIEISTIIL